MTDPNETLVSVTDRDLRWVSDPDVTGGVVERVFRVGDVPGITWLPATSVVPVPMVLIGHGGSGDKRSPRVVRLARWFASTGRFGALALDGPFHGERFLPDYQERVAELGVGVVTQQMMEDWLTTLDALRDQMPWDPEALGYIGFSMGARFGLALAAEMGPRVKAVVLGKYGLRDGGVLHPALHDPVAATAAAQRILCPVLFHLEWADEVFPRSGQLELFDAFGSPDKALLARNGHHGSSRASDEKMWREFVADRLAP